MSQTLSTGPLRDRIRVVRSAPPRLLPLFVRLQASRLVGLRRDEPSYPTSGPVHVLFVCHGNIMRSALSDALLRARLGPDDVEVRSAGLFARPGRGADPRAIEVGRTLGVDLEPHRAQSVTPELVAWAHLVIGMDWRNELELVARHPEAESRIHMLDAWNRDGRPASAISDPYTGTLDDVRACFARVVECIDGLAAALRQRARS